MASDDAFSMDGMVYASALIAWPITLPLAAVALVAFGVAEMLEKPKPIKRETPVFERAARVQPKPYLDDLDWDAVRKHNEKLASMGDAP